MTVHRRIALLASGLACLLLTSALSAQGSGAFRRFTEPQVVSGSGISSEIVLLNTSSTTCDFGVFAHTGAGNLADGVVLGGQPGGFAQSSVGPRSGTKISVESPDRPFIGAVTVDLLTRECFNSFSVQTQYRVRDDSGDLRELFSYSTPREVKQGQCAVAAACVDLDDSDGSTLVPGFAAVSVGNLQQVELCHTLKDANGAAVTPQICQPTNGSQQAQLITDIFGTGFETGDVSTWEVCLEGPPTTQTPSIDALFISVVTEGSALQFAGNEHQIRKQDCLEDEFTLCLSDRFQVTASFRETPSGPERRGRVGSVAPDQSGAFFFFDPDNLDLLVKVLNGCSFNDRFWVFSASATNVEYTLAVTDTERGELRTFSPPQTTGLNAITDTTAFATCP